MAAGIVVHVEVGKEKRTEFFSDALVSFGSSEVCDLQVHSKHVKSLGPWFAIEQTEDTYRLADFDKSLDIRLNGNPVRRFIVVNDGDVVSIGDSGISFTFYSLASESALITTNRSQTPVAPFIEEAALEAAASPERDDAKMFLKEFTRELLREVSWTTKAISLVLVIAFLTGILYIGWAVSSELRRSRELSQQQSDTIKNLEDKLVSASDQLNKINESSEEFKKMISLAPTLRTDYGNGVCLIVGVYDLVDKRNGRVIRYPDGQTPGANPYEQQPMEGQGPGQSVTGFTTSGGGAPVEYDFIGTGFHVGGGYVVSNRHVVQPWEGDDLVRQIMRDANGRPRVKRLVVYFPNFPQPFALKVRQVADKEDLSVSSIDQDIVSPDIPVLPLDIDSDAYAIGKTVITMGYPSGPDRLLAMLDDSDATTLNSRCLGSRQCIIDFLSQNQKIVPLLTQGAVTDLDSRRIVHDAKTAEGGSGAPLFGQTGKVIGVNFGVFTENTAANMAIPVKFVVELLKRAGWLQPENPNSDKEVTTKNPNAPTTR